MQTDEKESLPRIFPLGLDGVLVRFSDRLSEAANRAALAFRSEIDSAGIAGIAETAGSLAAVHVRYDPSAISVSELQAELRERLAARDWLAAPLPPRRKLWHVPAVFGGSQGPQLAGAAQLAGLTEAETIAQLSTARLRVMTIGFAPGLPYLGELSEGWDLPRHADLQTSVPPGALCLAVRQFVLFPTVSRTGWHHIAQTAFRGFRPEQAQPFPLSPGDEMVFPAVPAAELERMQRDPDGGARWERLP